MNDPKDLKSTGKVETNNLTGKDVQDEVLRTGKNVVRTTVVWTLASLATGFLREAIKGVFDASKRGKS